MKVVFDTNVLLSSTLWDGSVAQKLLFELIRSDSKIFSSTEIISEYKNILKRDFDYSDEEIAHIMKRVLAFVTLITSEEKLDVVKDDPDDNKILECAVSSASQYIITYDKHLLNIREFKGIKIIKPDETLKIIKS